MATNNSVNYIYLPLTGGTMTGNLILNADPSTGLQAVTKQYVDNVAGGGDYKNSTVAASTASLTVTYSNGAAGVGATLTNAGTMAAFSLDGQSPSVGQRVLIKNQSSAFQNGIYSVTVVGSGAVNWVLTRTLDYNTTTEIQPGDIVPVTAGTVNANTLWLQTATVNTIGTDSITFQQFQSAPLSLPVSLGNGGTNAALTASNGGIFYSTATAGAILAGTSTANQILQSGASTTPAWSTATYPATTTINRLLYSSSANVITDLPTANSSLLVTNGSGVPSLSTTIPNGVVATTQAASDNSTKVATTAYADAVGTTAGALVLIASGTASNSATLNFDNNLSATYDNYMVIIENLVAASNADFLMDVGTGGTPTYSATTYAGAASGTTAGSTIFSSDSLTTSFRFTANNTTKIQVRSTSTDACGAVIHITNTQNATNYKGIIGHMGGNFSQAAGSLVNGFIVSGGSWDTATALTSIRFKMSSGNISTGTFKLYGIKN